MNQAAGGKQQNYRQRKQSQEEIVEDVKYYTSYFKDKEYIAQILSEKSQQLKSKKEELDLLEQEVAKYKLIQAQLDENNSSTNSD